MQGRGLLDFDPEIERTARARRRAARTEMGDRVNDGAAHLGQNAEENGVRRPIPPLHQGGQRGNEMPAGGQHVDENEENAPRRRTMRDYTTPTVGSVYPGFGPVIPNQQFEIKPAILNMIRSNTQFAGMPNEDPHMHLADFSEICGTFRYNGITDETVKLRLFPFSLRDKAKAWLHSLPPGIATTWDALTARFLEKYNPVDKIVNMRREIGNFRQLDQESLAEAWERFNELLRKCPSHELQPWNLVEYFYFAIEPNYRAMIDAAAGGTLMNLTPEEALRLLQETASHSNYWTAGRSTQKNARGIFTLGTAIPSAATVMSIACEGCRGSGHHTYECPGTDPSGEMTDFNLNESVNFIANQNRGVPFGNAYNPGVRNHPNFSWNQNTAGQRWQPGQHQFDASAPGNQPRPPNPGYNQFPPAPKKSRLEEMMEKFVEVAHSNMTNQTASMRNLEVQLGQLAQAFAERTQGTLPSNTDKNPRDQGKSLGGQKEGSDIEVEVDCSINGVDTTGLADSGSTDNMLSLRDVEKFSLHMDADARRTLELANGTTVETEGEIKDVGVMVNGKLVVDDFHVLGPIENTSMPILGRPFLRKSGAILDFSKGCVVFSITTEPSDHPDPITKDTYMTPTVTFDGLSSSEACRSEEPHCGEEWKDEDLEMFNMDAFEAKKEPPDSDLMISDSLDTNSADDEWHRTGKFKVVSWDDPIATVIPMKRLSTPRVERHDEYSRWRSPTVEKMKKERALRASKFATFRGRSMGASGRKGIAHMTTKAYRRLLSVGT